MEEQPARPHPAQPPVELRGPLRHRADCCPRASWPPSRTSSTRGPRSPCCPATGSPICIGDRVSHVDGTFPPSNSSEVFTGRGRSSPTWPRTAIPPAAWSGLQGTARTVIEETGANNLYLALGNLRGSSTAVICDHHWSWCRCTWWRAYRGAEYRMVLDEAGTSTPNFCLLEKPAGTWTLGARPGRAGRGRRRHRPDRRVACGAHVGGRGWPALSGGGNGRPGHPGVRQVPAVA